ncbi:energy transducer TonB [Solimonas flava]|uniref:energy transducer TonB n=1 Tax=Solimonas flava TaxID=415849 RepID=UPI00040845A8|nr:energy transducer TonB [Solimonas flava]
MHDESGAPGTARRSPIIAASKPERSSALTLSVLLHVAVLLALLLPARQPPRPAAASPGLTLVQLPSAVTQRASAPAPAAAHPTTARQPAARRAAAASAATPTAAAATVQPAPTPSRIEDSAAAAAAAGAMAEAAAQAAAAPPPEAETDVPPPLDYLRRIARLIDLSQRYPWSARQYGYEGDAIVRMHLARDGRVLSATLLRSSGHAMLDAEALDVVRRIGRFPPFPGHYRPAIGEFDIDQPIGFRHYRY